MRHNINVPVIMQPGQRVPELQLQFETDQLNNFITANIEALNNFLWLFQAAPEALYSLVDTNFQNELQVLPEDQRHQALIREVAGMQWQPIAASLLVTAQAAIIEQAINYTHAAHVKEIIYEDGRESRERLYRLVQPALELDRIQQHPVELQLNDIGTIIAEDLQRYLNRVYSETVRDVYTIIDSLEEPVSVSLYSNFFNDVAPTKYTLDMLERFQQGQLAVEEIVMFAKNNPSFFMNELLGQRSRVIDLDANIAGDEKLTTKAGAYQLLKSIFLADDETETNPDNESKARTKEL